MFEIVFKKFKSDFKKVKVVFNKFFGTLLWKESSHPA